LRQTHNAAALPTPAPADPVGGCSLPREGAGGRQAQGRLLLAEDRAKDRQGGLPVPRHRGLEVPEAGALQVCRSCTAEVSARTALMALQLLVALRSQAATVLSIGDGGTLRVLDGGRRVTVRLACIDAPEMAQAPYGVLARSMLAGLTPLLRCGGGLQLGDGVRVLVHPPAQAQRHPIRDTPSAAERAGGRHRPPMGSRLRGSPPETPATLEPQHPVMAGAGGDLDKSTTS